MKTARTVAFAMAATLAVNAMGWAACDGDVAVVAAARQALDAGKPEEAMTAGKLEADLGHHGTACAIYALVADSEADTKLGWEALVRKGSAQRSAGDHAESVKAYQEVFATYGQDRDALAFLAQAITGIRPDPRYWEDVWQQVRFELDTSDPARPAPRVVLPDVDASAATATPSDAKSGLHAPWTGEPISMNLKDADLEDLFRLFAEFADLHLVLDGAVRGKTVTLVLDQVPWDQALALVIKTQGLRSEIEGNVLRIFGPDRVGPGTATAAIDDDFRRGETERFLTSVSLCLRAHEQDHGGFPSTKGQAVDVADIASQLEPTYIATLPRNTAFGSPIRYASDGKTATLTWSADWNGATVSGKRVVPSRAAQSPPK